METNTCDINHLDANALLPPRKRLLAGLKRQSPDANFHPPSFDSEYDTRLNNLLRSHLSNPNFSNGEIIELSRCAAIKAVKIAEAARANADQKAVKAAKAVAIAKNALDFVANLSEEEFANQEDECQKKNKTKKHVPVRALYHKKKEENTNCTNDEEMARKLHQAINSSPRNLRKSPGADSNSHKNKKMKISDAANNGAGNGIDMLMVDLNTSEHDIDYEEVNLETRKTKGVVLENGGFGDEILDGLGKKKGRIKQKKLSLSICSLKDQSESSPKEELIKQPLFTIENSSNSSMWKCQAFKAPDACLVQNKVMQS